MNSIVWCRKKRELRKTSTAMYESLGISLALAALLTINAVASLAVAGLWRLIERPMRRCSARAR